MSLESSPTYPHPMGKKWLARNYQSLVQFSGSELLVECRCLNLEHVMHGVSVVHSLWPMDSSLLGGASIPGKDTRVSCHFLLQGIFPTQDWTLVLCLHQQVDSWLVPPHYLPSLPVVWQGRINTCFEAGKTEIFFLLQRKASIGTSSNEPNLKTKMNPETTSGFLPDSSLSGTHILDVLPPTGIVRKVAYIS